MPKVETLPNYRGVITSNSSIYQNYVSKAIGIHSSNNKIRYKRNVITAEEPSPKRRVVKKLIRVEPIYNRTAVNSGRNYFHPNDYLRLNLNNRYVDRSEEYVGQPSNIPRNYHRKRVIVKKKRKNVAANNVVNNTEEYSAETSNKRRRVIITRKRVLHPSTASIYNGVENGENAISNEEIKPSRRVRVKKIKHTLNPISESFGKLDSNSSRENIIPDTSTEHIEDVSPISEETPQLAILKDSDNNITDDVKYSTEVYSEEDGEYEEDDRDDEANADGPRQDLPDYEPFFPELSESLDAPILLLKTTILSSVDLQTKTVVQSKLRTYTFVVTRVNGNEQIVTSTTEVKPHTKTIVVTEPVTRYTTLTLLDLDATETLPFIPMTVIPSVESSKQPDIRDKPRALDEARYNLATRIMSNGVEVIVAGDKSTLPGEPDVKRVLPSTIYKPVTLKPSTLTNNMMMALPQDASNIENLSSSLYPNQFVTKTCLTTFTYMTTYLENGTTAVSSHEQVVSNIATEERNTGKILPTPTMGITLTQYPNLAVGTFVTTYTYLNTILDGEQPLVVTSKRSVTNTVTAPDDYLSLFQPDDKASAIKDTNTYYSTLALQKTLYEGKISKVISTNEVVTQVVITESIPPKGTSVMTSYIALDFDDHGSQSKEYSTTDVVKTYFVTYTYFNTLVDGGNTIINTNVSTSSDVVTEKLFLHPKKTKGSSKNIINTSPIIKESKKKNKIDADISNLNIFATKTYLTTFTYYTTLLQEENNKISTIISSHSRVVENIQTDIIEPSMLDKKYLNSIKKEIKEGSSSIVKLATLNDGQKIEITAVLKDKIKPTKVLPIEKTKMPEVVKTTPSIESSNPNVVTGSTIIFVDEFDDPFAFPTQHTPSLSKISKTQSKNALNSLLSSEIVKHPQQSSVSKRKNNSKRSKSTIAPSKSAAQAVTKVKGHDKSPETKIAKPSPVSNLLGSINIQALTPVLNAMAGLIKTNLKANKRNDSVTTTTPKNAIENEADVQNRSPIYIPVGGLADIETAESQNIANIWEDGKYLDKVVGKPTHESPLLNGGIPISPGEVITANSDVIVGKQGRIGPRIPAIPLQHPDLSTTHPQEIPLGMKPPPVPNKTWPKRHSDHQTVSTHPIIHAPNKDDYVGPPPPKIPVRPQNLVRGEKYKGNDHRHIPINSFGSNDDYKQVTIPNNQYYNNFAANKNKQERMPVEDVAYNGGQFLQDGVFVSSMPNFNLQPSILNEPIVLPEVIERSTGQPLLVNIQPSQVAFVNIPHNRTTALIYGGSTEPHINGQYFDDPSPYPEPEFSAIDSYSNGVPKFASIYNDQPDQKEVGGVIKVGTHPININPPAIPVGIQQLDIRPSRPSNMNLINGVLVNSHINHHDINVHVPPISFGMVHQGDDFNAHIINHDDVSLKAPPLSYHVVKGNEQRYGEVHGDGTYPAGKDNKPPYPFVNFNNKNAQNNPEQNYVPHHQIDHSKNNNPEQNYAPHHLIDHSKNNNPEQNYAPHHQIDHSKNNNPEHNYAPHHQIDHSKNNNLLHAPPNNAYPHQVIGGNQVNIKDTVEHYNSNNGHRDNNNRGEGHVYKNVGNINSHQQNIGYHNKNIGGTQWKNDNSGNYEANNYQEPNRNYPSQQSNNANSHIKIPGNNQWKLSIPNDNIPAAGHHETNFPEENRPPLKKPSRAPFNDEAKYTPHQFINLINKHRTTNPNIPPSVKHTNPVDPAPNLRPPVEFLRPHVRPKRPRPKPAVNYKEISDLMAPPPLTISKISTQNQNTYPQIELGRFPSINHPNPFQRPNSHHIPLSFDNYGMVNVSSNPIEHLAEDFGDDGDDDLVNEDGEVIQESNSRPLIPGQIPIEILRANATTTTTTSTTTTTPRTTTTKTPNKYNYIPHENEVLSYMPNIKQPRPFNNPVVRPENHQTNQVNHQESNVIVQSGNPNVYANVFDYHLPHNVPVYIPTTTERTDYTRTSQPPNYYPNIQTRPQYGVRYTNRPKVTSLPLDPKKVTTKKPAVEISINSGSQTEEPFKTYTKPSSSILNFGTQDIPRGTRRTTTTTKKPRTTGKQQLHLNTGEIQASEYNVTKVPLEMEIMRPPPVYTGDGFDVIRIPEVNLNPPPDREIVRTTIKSTPRTTSKPFVHEIPVTPKASSEEVMGMTPPPVTTNLSKKPVYSMEIDIPEYRYTTKPATNIYEAPTTAQPPRTRRPATRRPTRRTTTRTTTVPATTRKQLYWQRPVTPINYVEVNRNKTGNNQHVRIHNNRTNIIDYHSRPNVNRPEGFTTQPNFGVQNHTRKTPTTTVTTTTQFDADVITIKEVPIHVTTEYYKPTSESDYAIEDGGRNETVINPVTDLSSEETNSPVIDAGKPKIPHIEILGSENYDFEMKSTEVMKDTPILPTGTVETVELELPSKIAPTRINYYTHRGEITPQVHHVGNEVKIIDDGTTTHRRRIVTSVFKRPLRKDTKVALPTRYITHTKTSTVTITKTTVVKSLGAPPSTLTILITKTEKLTIVDTVTEFHTLVKPTTIAETVIISHQTSLYPPNGTYGAYPIAPTQVHASEVEPTIVVEGVGDDLEEFIIHDTDTTEHQDREEDEDEDGEESHDNDSFFVVMTDKNQGSIIKIPKAKEDSRETQHRDEMLGSNEVNRVLLGGILIASPPSLETSVVSDRCTPECKASRNELCQKTDGLLRCACRPGFARMFPDRPCKPTYTYTMRIGLEKHGKEYLHYEDALSDMSTPEFITLASATHEGLDRMVMQSDLRDIYHGVHVQNYEPIAEGDGVVNTFNLQLSDNIDETRLKDVFKKYLRNNNYSLGGTELYASKEIINRLEADDFDECSNAQYHDCSEYSHCFNLRGTYTCSCKEGYADLSENILYPGRICSSELVGCDKCHYHGTCYSRGDDQIICECFQWYAGESCQVNLKVLLIALVTLGAILFTLLMICIIITCARRKPDNHMVNGMSFLPQRVPMNRRGGTMDRRAMIQDTSSESGHSDNTTLPYVAKKTKKLKGALKKTKPVHMDVENGESALTYSEQKDRSLTVMIPRAKYHPAPPTSPHNMTSFDKRKTSAASSNEAKLLSYLDAGPSPNKVDQRKYSKTSENYRDMPGSRKTSGALVSAGFEVSATVGVNNLGTLGTIVTTCGTEADRSENATLIQKISADLLSSTGTQSQFNTLRKSITDADEDALENWLDITPRIQTISESRSYDETTIQPPMKSFRNDYDSKSSQHHQDEADTMAERDLGSTFLLPHTHLYKPDRGSDISGFESL